MQRVCKPLLSCLLLVAVLFTGVTWVRATDDAPAPAEVFTLNGTQVCDGSDDTVSLRFGFTLGCSGVSSDENYNTVIEDEALVTVGGTAYPLVGFGARVALSEKTVDRPYASVVPADKLYSVNEDGTVTYTVRVVGIDADNLKTAIYVRGYVSYLDGDQVKKTYTTAVYVSSYYDAYVAANFPGPGDKVHEYLELGAVTVDMDAGTGTMVVKNISKGWETEQSSSLLFTCYNAAGTSLGDVRINIGRIHADKSSDPLAFALPAGTARMEFTQCEVQFWTDGFH